MYGRQRASNKRNVSGSSLNKAGNRTSRSGTFVESSSSFGNSIGFTLTSLGPMYTTPRFERACDATERLRSETGMPAIFPVLQLLHAQEGACASPPIGFEENPRLTESAGTGNACALARRARAESMFHRDPFEIENGRVEGGGREAGLERSLREPGA